MEEFMKLLDKVDDVREELAAIEKQLEVTNAILAMTFLAQKKTKDINPQYLARLPKIMSRLKVVKFDKTPEDGA